MKIDSRTINNYWTDIYYHLHYPHTEKITHQVIRILQHVQKQESVGIKEIANHLNISQNTASDHIKRIIKKGFLLKRRNPNDEGKLDAIFLALGDEEKEMILNSFKLLSNRAEQCM